VSEKEQSATFQNWLDLHKGLIFKFVKSYADTRMDQEDLFQEIAMQIWKSIPNFRNESAATTWIYRVALNTAISWIRVEKKKQNRIQQLDLTHNILEDNTAADDRLAWLYKEIQQLDKIDRSLALLLLDDLSHKEIALILGISESNVAVKLHRIKKRLTLKSKTYDHYGI
jgi:RNA polymerase sigma-70 factor (ECF subfamily)